MATTVSADEVAAEWATRPDEVGNEQDQAPAPPLDSELLTSPLPPVRRIVAIVALCVAAVVLTIAVFEGLVTGLMYDHRQNHLAADFAEPRNTVAPGDAVAVLQIPAIDLNVMVIEGDSVANLRAGPAHRRGSPLPGANGNSVILGRSNRYGAPFGRLSEVAEGDLIVVRSRTDQAPLVPVAYTVSSVDSVKASQTHALRSSGDRRLTLVTSTGGFTSSDRLVISAIAEGLDPTLPAADPNAGSAGGYDDGRASALFNIQMLGAYLLVVAAVGVVAFLRSRASTASLVLVLAPIVALITFVLLLNLDNILVTTR